MPVQGMPVPTTWLLHAAAITGAKLNPTSGGGELSDRLYELPGNREG